MSLKAENILRHITNKTKTKYFGTQSEDNRISPEQCKLHARFIVLFSRALLLRLFRVCRALTGLGRVDRMTPPG